jgi:6-phosphofructokinase 2
MLEEINVPFAPVKVQEETRENIIINEKETGRHYQFMMPPPELNEQGYNDILNMLETKTAGQLDYLVVSGSMPDNFPADIFTKLRAFAQRTACRLIVDTSGVPLVRALEAGVYLAKPNLNELAKLTGRTALEGNAIEKAAREVLSVYKCEILVVSLGREGAMMVTIDRCYVFSVTGPAAKSTVGAGDSMVAGMIHYLASGRPLEEMVKFGVACGTAATLHEGTELCQLDDVQQIYEFVKQVR